MKIIQGGRRDGKTTKLIQEAAETFSYIVCSSGRNCKLIADQAKKMKVDIPYPLTYDEFINKRYRGKNISGFCIDDVDMLLMYMSGIVPIKAITISYGTSG